MTWITDHVTTSHAASADYSLVTTKGTSVLYDFEGTAFTTNDFTDSSKVCFDIEVKYSGDTSDGTGRPAKALTVKLHEVLFNQGDQTVNEGEDSVNINLSGMVYGSVDFGSLDFTTGTDQLP